MGPKTKSAALLFAFMFTAANVVRICDGSSGGSFFFHGMIGPDAQMEAACEGVCQERMK
jgi:hypothetical protein